MPSPFDSLCVFCGSGSGTNPTFVEAARETGRLLAERSIRVVYGGGNVGLIYDELVAFCGKTQVEAGFISAEGAANLVIDDTAPGLLERLEAAVLTGPSAL